MNRLILDTTVIVASERGRLSLDELIGDDDDVAIAAITAAHALLLAYARRSGRVRGAHGLAIAATALARKRVVVTADHSGFSELPGVAVSVHGSAH